MDLSVKKVLNYVRSGEDNAAREASQRLDSSGRRVLARGLAVLLSEDVSESVKLCAASIMADLEFEERAGYLWQLIKEFGYDHPFIDSILFYMGAAGAVRRLDDVVELICTAPRPTVLEALLALEEAADTEIPVSGELHSLALRRLHLCLRATRQDDWREKYLRAAIGEVACLVRFRGPALS